MEWTTWFFLAPFVFVFIPGKPIETVGKFETVVRVCSLIELCMPNPPKNPTARTTPVTTFPHLISRLVTARESLPTINSSKQSSKMRDNVFQKQRIDCLEAGGPSHASAAINRSCFVFHIRDISLFDGEGVRCDIPPQKNSFSSFHQPITRLFCLRCRHCSTKDVHSHPRQCPS